MSRNIISDDLPYEGPLGDVKLYVVRLDVATENGIDLYDVAVEARSLHDAAVQAGHWCRRQFNRPARGVMGIGTPESHEVQLRRAHGEYVAGASTTPYTDEEAEEVFRTHDLRTQGAGAYRLVDSETFADE